MFIKRLFDIICSVVGLVVLAPLMLVAAIGVRVKMGSPVLFRQSRPGLAGKPFQMYKFRTMTNRSDAAGKLLPDSERLTAFGSFLRSTSIDELPELINVLKGDMSLVGPRPLLTEYLPLYSKRQARRHEVRPGITGWAQVNGRNNLPWEERLEMDVWYVDNRTFLRDLMIIAMTVAKVLMRKDVAQTGEATARPFEGDVSFRPQGEIHDPELDSGPPRGAAP